MQAEQGQVFVVAASHLIFRRRQPSQALITARGGVSQVDATMVMLYCKTWPNNTFESLVAIVLVDKDIVYLACQFCNSGQEHLPSLQPGRLISLFWVSL